MREKFTVESDSKLFFFPQHLLRPNDPIQNTLLFLHVNFPRISMTCLLKFCEYSASGPQWTEIRKVKAFFFLPAGLFVRRAAQRGQEREAGSCRGAAKEDWKYSDSEGQRERTQSVW